MIKLLNRIKLSDLWINKPFLFLWSGFTIYQIGYEISSLALPTIAINMFGASADKVGLLRTIETSPYIIFGLFAGMIVDRYDPIKIMILSLLICLLSILSIPVAFIYHFLNMKFLYAVVGLTGTFAALYTISNTSYLPFVLEKKDLASGNSKTTISKSGARMLGPAFSGWLIEFFSAIGSILVNAVSYLLSLMLLLRMKKDTPALKNKNSGKMFQELIDGLKFIFANPLLRYIAIVTSIINLGYSMMNSVLLIFAYKQLHFSPKKVGLILTLSSFGIFLGALSAKNISKIIGYGKCLFLSNLLFGLVITGIPICLFFNSTVFLIIILFLIACITPIYDINQVTLRQLITPNELQGRMNANMRTLIWAMIPFGAFIGGILAIKLGFIYTFLISGLTVIFSSFILLLGPVFKIKEIACSN